MSPEQPLSEDRLVDQFLSALEEAPDTTAHLRAKESADTRDWRADAVVEVEVAGKSLLLLVEVKRSAYPRDVREAVWQLRNHLAHREFWEGRGEVVPIIVAESISPGAKDLLRTERVGYYDTGGSLYVPAQGAYFYVDKPMPKRQARSLRSLFSGRRAQVLQAILAQGKEWFGVTDVARQALVSPATASETLTELDRLEWVDVRGQGPMKERRLIDPRALLDAWAKHQSSSRPPTMRRYFVHAPGVDALIHRLSKECEERAVRYAITGEAAAQAYAPYLSKVSQVRCRMLAGSAAEETIGALDARAVNEGWNLGIIESKSPGDFAFREQRDDVWLASPAQTYVDLLQGDGRAKEMAEHLRHEKLKF